MLLIKDFMRRLISVLSKVEDARVAMRLYQLHKREWEEAVKARVRKIQATISKTKSTQLTRQKDLKQQASQSKPFQVMLSYSAWLAVCTFPKLAIDVSCYQEARILGAPCTWCNVAEVFLCVILYPFIWWYSLFIKYIQGPRMFETFMISIEPVMNGMWEVLWHHYFPAISAYAFKKST